GTVRPSTNGTIRPSTNGTIRPSTNGTIRPSTNGTVRPDTTRPQPRDTVSALVVRVFPNPASVRLVVGYNNLPPAAERVTVRILNIMGEEIAQQTVGANENEVIFDVSRLREGQYAVVVHAGRAVGRAVVIIRH
ncbi:MAG: T9SS type A sorting domain-containing protein, partial [Candidatus Kapaibacteriota bacterium]